jgi:hypothetical protein
VPSLKDWYRTHLKGLVPYKDVSVHGETELTTLKERRICLGLLAICVQYNQQVQAVTIDT